MINSLRKQPWYLLLLPLFFVMHGYTENFGFINLGDTLILVFTYVTAAIILYFLFLIILKNRIKAALAASFVMAFYLFFGAIQDFCKAHLAILDRYSVLLPLFVIIFIVTIIDMFTFLLHCLICLIFLFHSPPYFSNVLQAMKVLVDQAILFNLVGK